MSKCMRLFQITLALFIVFAIYAKTNAQGGMNKATAKLLITDLIEAGFAPTIREANGSFIITVGTDAATAATAAQVHTFANNRGVAAKVLVVQFE